MQVWEVRDRGVANVKDKAAADGVGVVAGSTLKKQRLRVYDPGFTNTAACTSRITYLDGENGILRYRGYPIEQLAERSSFMEVSYLLYFGELPSEADLRRFEANIRSHAVPHQDIERLISTGFRANAHPMGVLASVVMAMGTLYPEANPALQGNSVYDDRALRVQQMTRIIAVMPSIVACIYRTQAGLPPAVATVSEDGQGPGFSEQFLSLLTRISPDQPKVHAKLARALDVLFILHADHELNCSTATMRQLTSSGVDVYTSVAGSIGALYGPLHGGATEAVLKMLERIGTAENVPGFLRAVKQREEKLMGFGHRVYRNYDPRARIIKRIAYEVFEVVGQKDPLIDLATELEKAALSDEYFISRKLYPNVDFYSGLIYKAIGFPTEMFPCLFAIGRSAGWLAHWNEFLDDPDRKIARPMQLYRGSGQREYIDVEDRPAQVDVDMRAVRPHIGVMPRL